MSVVDKWINHPTSPAGEALIMINFISANNQFSKYGHEESPSVNVWLPIDGELQCSGLLLV